MRKDGRRKIVLIPFLHLSPFCTQDQYDCYRASFGPWSLDEVIEFLEWDFGDKLTPAEAAWIRSFAGSGQSTTEIRVASE